mmetsp:Transcript_5754/g.13544  ORF Transcript_5754/g.13544 Transcript_5754/m.13544 type:complete len:319 (-) Transcript_5754:158-1114(-)
MESYTLDLSKHAIGSTTCLLLLAPPHDVSDNTDNQKDEQQPSKELSGTTAWLGSTWKEFINSLARRDILSVVAEVFHLFFALHGCVCVKLFAHLTKFVSGFVFVVFETVRAVLGDQATAGVRKSPSVGDISESNAGFSLTSVIREESKLDVIAIFGTGGSNEELVVFIWVVITLNFRLVFFALGVLVAIKVIVPVHVIFLVFEVSINKVFNGDGKVSVSFLASCNSVTVASTFRRTQTQKSSSVRVSTFIVKHLLRSITTNELEVVLGQVRVFILISIVVVVVIVVVFTFFAFSFLVQTTGIAENLGGSFRAQRASRG